ncbi:MULTISPECIES: HAD-IIA family hydrolase [Actinoalloteichus]|uniref:Sugar phosphatase of HAD superfamily n=1 Tax=Actinoalloteichus fjordicus TaxID=1612552 RepID=A0AAC9LGJ3_9PSEU|nr:MULTISPECIES: HAD-IIA family hydrolase [Actinoalloteichus]APU16337.1 putative sugar phosphatase of HAD superfamily [Actinoalloteichus fjordicus]APU22396.1 putative sugar phosphatase of HAD superfamily [Actinoalloteichus sp. GBA129-24]
MGGFSATREDVEAGRRLLDRYDALLLDLDGTVFRGGEPVADAQATLVRARAAGVTLRFVTNNASRTPGEVAEHLRMIGFAADAPEVSTSAQAGAAMLADRLDPGTEVLVVGAAALRSEVLSVGLRPVPAAEAVSPERFAAVVQGHSVATAWPDLAAACQAIRSGAWWVACNLDPTVPTERGQLPGNGSMVAALRAATGRTPDVAGKPRAPLFEQAARSADSARPLVVGDRLDTDIEGAVAGGMDALLVLSGVTDPAGLLAAEPARRPGFLAADLDSVLDDAESLRITSQPDWRIDVVEGGLTVRTSDSAAAQGPPSALGLLRGLCAAWWARHESAGGPAVRPLDEASRAVVNALGL